MRFINIIEAWEKGFRGKFKDSGGNIGICTNSGLFWENNTNPISCNSININDNSYELIRETIKATFEEIFTDINRFSNKKVYPICNELHTYPIDVEPKYPIDWMNYFHRFYCHFPILYKCTWATKE